MERLGGYRKRVQTCPLKCCTLVWSRLAERCVSLVSSVIPPVKCTMHRLFHKRVSRIIFTVCHQSSQSNLPACNSFKQTSQTFSIKMLFLVDFMLRHARIKHLCGSFIIAPLLSSCLSPHMSSVRTHKLPLHASVMCHLNALI